MKQKLKEYLTFKHFKGDLVGGLTAGIVALPLALAFGVSSGLGPSAGLYGAIFLSFFAAFFGGTNTQISGPTAPMTAVSMVVIAGIIATHNGNVAEALPYILLIFLMAGGFQVIIGVLKLGQYIKYIPYPVVSGFMTAIGLMIIFTQTSPILGYIPKEDTEYVQTFKVEAEDVLLEKILEDEAKEGILVLEDFPETIKRADMITQSDIDHEAASLADKNSKDVLGSLKILPRALQNIKWFDFLLAISTIVIIYGFKKITTKIPSTLVALILVTLVANLVGKDYNTIESIPDSLPILNYKVFTVISFENISPYIFTALTLAFLGAIDSLLTSVVADNMTKTKHSSNKEIIGQGIGNSIAALFGGLPGAGATIRTVVNINAGGKTRLSGMVAGVMLLLILLLFAPTASKIPAAVLAGILFTVGVGVMDYKGLKAIPKMLKDIKIGPLKLSSDVLIMVVVMLLSTFWDLINAVGIGLIMASIIFMKKIGDLTAQETKIKPLNESKWNDELDFPENLKEEVLIKHINGPLFFGSTSDFQQLSKQIPDSTNTVIIRADKMNYMDQSGLYAMEDVIIDLKQKNINVLFVGLHTMPKNLLENIKLIPNLVEKELVFDKINEAFIWINENVKDTV